MNIAFVCLQNDNFVKPIIEHVEKNHTVQRFKPGGTALDLLAMMNWADVTWFEWCDQAIVTATQSPTASRVVCRLHSYEAFTPVPSQVTWANVDDLIFVAPHIRDITLATFPVIETKEVNCHVIPNGVDVNRFTLSEKEAGYNIAYVGYLNHKKNPGLLLQCIRSLVDIDDRYKLHVAGVHQEGRIQLYWDHIVDALGLDDHVIMHGWIDDMNAWLQDKHYAVSTSYLESFCYGIAEPMCCGLKPVIHNWIGAGEIYPKEYLFNTLADFCRMVHYDLGYYPAIYRQYIADNYSLDKLFGNIDEFLDGQ